jgi:hypothetical protein
MGGHGYMILDAGQSSQQPAAKRHGGVYQWLGK